MKKLKLPAVPGSEVIYFYGGLALVAGVAILWILNGGARTIARSVAAVPGEAVAGVAEGIGDSIGIPRTNQTQCDQDLAAGRTWAASFSCPAGRFIGSFFGSSGDEQAKPIDRAGESSGVDTYIGM